MPRSTNSQQTQGVPSVSLTANKAGAGAVVAASSGDTIVITDRVIYGFGNVFFFWIGHQQ